MATKAPDAAGWVIEVVTLAPESPPTFKYFNVAIADVTEAVQAIRMRRDVVQANRVEAVKALSAKEIAALRLRAGQVKPA